MSIQLEYATLAALGRVHKVLRTKLPTVIATRPTDTSGFFADLAGEGISVHLPTPGMRLAPLNAVPQFINEDVAIWIYHRNDRTTGQRTTGGPTYYIEVGSLLTVGVYVQCLHVDINTGGVGPSREPPNNEAEAVQTSKETSYYRAELYAGAVEYALMKWGKGGGELYDIRRAEAPEFGYAEEPQSHAYARVEFTVNQDLQIPTNTFDLT